MCGFLSPWREEEKQNAFCCTGNVQRGAKTACAVSSPPGERKKSRTHFAAQEAFSEEQKPHELFPSPRGERKKSRTYFAAQEIFSEERKPHERFPLPVGEG